MVKSIISTLVAIALCIGFFIWTDISINKELNNFHEALQTLSDKVENKEANREDAYAVRSMWENSKSTLHVYLPHNDVSYLDYWLNETCGLIYTKNYELALGKIEVMLAITKNLPNSYSLMFENIF